SQASLARSKAYSAFAAEFLDSIQGLATLKAFGQSAARLTMLETRGWALFRSTMWVLGTNTLARGITDTGIAVGAAVALGWGAYGSCRPWSSTASPSRIRGAVILRTRA